MQNYHTEPVGEPATPEDKQTKSSRRMVVDILETLLLAALLYVAIESITARIRVDGFSMQPTMQSGEFVIVNKLAYKFSKPKTGDVIVFQYPRDPEQEYIKRVIGTPGDIVVVEEGLVSVNGKTIEEPYIASAPAYQNSWTVPENSLFVLGDNRNNSSDSHSWGAVSIDNVIGKAFFVYWPPERWGFVEHAQNSTQSP